jgi:hypothetical protein
MLKTILTSAAAAWLAGCASIPSYSLDDWRAAQSHHFAHTTSAQFEAALTRVFEASNPKAYTLRPTPTGVIAERPWREYLVIAAASGTEEWQLSYKQAGDGVDAQADLSNVPGMMIPPVAASIQRPDSTASYDLLWSRLDYVLGNRPDWLSCAAWSAPLRHHSVDVVSEWGLCGLGAADAPPLRLAESH